MSSNSLQDILPLVEQPSRYLGTEINSVKKDFDHVRLRIALAFPDLYEIGMSHFGIQILYSVLNNETDIAAERVFAPAVDMEAYLRAGRIPLASLESRKPLKQFDIIGFSLLYELNYTNVLTMLDLAGIPFFSDERDASCPLIIAGGPCVCNPEPVADFFDAMVMGDGEEVILEMTSQWVRWKEEGDGSKKSLLKMWAGIRGVYVPSFFEPEFDSDGFQILKPLYPAHHRVLKAIVPDLNKALFPDSPVIPFGRPIHDRLRVEIARGCTRGCRFCQAGMIYRPVRERSPEQLLALTDRAIASTGYEDISLLSLSTGDYGRIISLMQQLMGRCQPDHISVSMPSLRAGTLTPELMELIKKVRKTGFTIAPEAGSQRLRDVINKNITRDDIVKTVEDSFRLGWQLIKLYFMIGLPTETDEDLSAIVSLVNELRPIRGGKGRKGHINVSVATMIPKPHTPFQWASQISLEASKEKIRWLQDSLRMPGIQFKWQNPEISFLEGIWARGDRRLSRLLVTAFKKGCRFDGWSDQFRFDLWQEAIAEEGLDAAFYTSRQRSVEEPLPWDHMDMGIGKSFMKKEWEAAFAGERTPDCRNGDCQGCGVCDFKTIKPVVFKEDGAAPLPALQPGTPSDNGYKKITLSYEKRGLARCFGHLELVNLFTRAIRRAGIPIKFSEGFHPMPKISFGDPLPIGMESEKEDVYLTVSSETNPADVPFLLNPLLPEGIVLHEWLSENEMNPSGQSRPHLYRVTLKEGAFDETRLSAFVKMTEMVINRVNRKGNAKQINLKEMVIGIKLISPRILKLALAAEPGKTMRPSEVIACVFGISKEQLILADILKLDALPAD